MLPVSGNWDGAFWYKTILQSAVCPGDGTSYYTTKPEGWDVGEDALYWAIVLPPSSRAAYVQFTSGGVVIATFYLYRGLNYGSIFGVNEGHQSMQLYDINRGRCVSAECPDCIYNMNPQVVGLGSNPGDTGQCPGNCVYSPSSSGGGIQGDSGGNGAIVYIDPIIWTEENPTVACVAPCILILPPLQLASPTTITFPHWVTSLEIFWVEGSTVITGGDGSVETSLLYDSVIETTTLSIPDGT